MCIRDRVAIFVLARLRIIRVGEIQAEEVVAVIVGAKDGDVWVVFHTGELGGFEASDIDLAAEQLRQPRAGVRHNAGDQTVHIGCAFPIGLVARHDHIIVARPTLEDKGAGAGGRRFVERAGHDVAEVSRVQMAGQPARCV